MLGHIVGVVEVSAGLTSDNGDLTVGVTARHVGRKNELEEFVVKRTAVGDVGGRCRAYIEDFERAYPVEGEFGLEDGGLGAFLGTLSDGGRGVTDPCPTTGGEPGGSTEGV